MRYYCTLFIRSNNQNAATHIFKTKAINLLEFEDGYSEANLARAKRWQKVTSIDHFTIRNDLPRYRWSLSSNKEIETSDPDPQNHISWLISQLKLKTSLIDAQQEGTECTLAFYWGSSGTGGGPVITPQLSALLLHHQLKLDIGFYFESQAPGAACN